MGIARLRQAWQHHHYVNRSFGIIPPARSSAS
jgi:hypothetical protein